MDVSEGMLNVALEHAVENDVRENVTFVKLDATTHGAELDAANVTKQFDLVICSVVLHHTMEPEVVLKRLCKCVKPGGHLFVAEMEKALPQPTLVKWMTSCGVKAELEQTVRGEFTFRGTKLPITLTIGTATNADADADASADSKSSASAEATAAKEEGNGAKDDK